MADGEADQGQVQNSARHQGRVLVIGEDGKAPIVVIGFLMERKLTFFQAFQLVHSKRYVINLDALDIQELIREEKRRQKDRGAKEHYQCICGLNKWKLLLPLDNSEVACNCQIGDSNTACPYYGCGKVCDEMAEKYKGSWRHQSLKWGRTIKDSVQASFDSVDYDSTQDLRFEKKTMESILLSSMLLLVLRRKHTRQQ